MADSSSQHVSAPTAATSCRGVLRVAYVVHTFDMGGIERSVARLCNGLDRRRFAPLVVCLNRSGDAAQWLTAKDVPIVELHKAGGNDWRVVGRLARALRERKVDVVHSHNWGTLLETVAARRWAGTPRHVHAERGTLFGGAAATGWRARLRVPLARWAFSQADQLLTNAQSIAGRLERVFGLPAANVQVIPNGVDLPGGPPTTGTRQHVRERLGVAPDDVVIGSVGRLVEVKDFATLVRALAQVAASGRQVHLLLVGDGPLKPALMQLAESLGIAARLHLSGQQEAVGDWLAAMDVYVNSSVSEGMSQSIVEALAAGLPLAVTDVGDNALLAGRGGEPNGLVSPAGDDGALAANLQQLVDNPGLRKTFGARSLASHAENYSVPGMLRRYETLYAELAAR